MSILFYRQQMVTLSSLETHIYIVGLQKSFKMKYSEISSVVLSNYYGK